MLVHGGGWQGSSKDNLVAEARALAMLGYVAVSVDYRLAPKHLYPAAVEDVVDVVSWLRAKPQVEEWSIDPARIGILGASAGGNIAAMVGTLGEGL